MGSGGSGGAGNASGNASGVPSGNASGVPSGNASGVPSGNASGVPSGNASGVPSGNASGVPSGNASGVPSGNASGVPSGYASGVPSGYASGVPSGNASGVPSGNASGVPSGYASGVPSGNASGVPSGNASGVPSNASGYASGVPSGNASGYASGYASGNPSGYASGDAGGGSYGSNFDEYFRGIDLSIDDSLDQGEHGVDGPEGTGLRTKIFDARACTESQRKAQEKHKKDMCAKKGDYRKTYDQEKSCTSFNKDFDKIFYYQYDGYCLTNHGANSNTGRAQTHFCEYNTGCDPKSFPYQTYLIEPNDVSAFQDNPDGVWFYLKPKWNSSKCLTVNYGKGFHDDSDGTYNVSKVKVAFWYDCVGYSNQKWRMLHKYVPGHGKVLFLRTNQNTNECLSRWGDYWSSWHGTLVVGCSHNDKRQMFVDEKAAWEAATK